MERVRWRARPRLLLVMALGVTVACGREAEQAGPETQLEKATDDGSTACWIDVHGDCHGWVPVDSWFGDDWNGSPTNAAACLHRAREFVTWCGLGNPNDIVYAAFNSNGVTVMAQSFKPAFDFGNVDPQVVTYGYNWAPLATSATDTTVVGAADPSTSRYPNIWMMQ